MTKTLCKILKELIKELKEKEEPGVMVVYAFNLSTWKVEAGGSLGLNSKTLSQKQTNFFQRILI